jgi:hypothetical protein
MVTTDKQWTAFGANYNVYAKKVDADDFYNNVKLLEYANDMGIKGTILVAHSKEWRIIEVKLPSLNSLVD